MIEPIGQPTVGGNLKHLQSQVNRSAAARQGHVTIAAGEGSTTWTASVDQNDTSSQHTRITPEAGIEVRVKGAMVRLQDLLESMLATDSGLKGMQEAITKLRSDVDGLMQTIKGKVDLTYVDPKLQQLTADKANLSYVDAELKAIKERLAKGGL